MRPDAYVNGNVDLKLLAEALRGAKYVFLINDNDIVVALASDFLTNPEYNFLTGWFDIPGFGTNGVEQFLRENNILYRTVLEDFPNEAVSPDGRFVACADGIYLVGSNEKIVEAPTAGREHLSLRGRINDGRGVIYSRFRNPCLIETNFVLDDRVCIFEVPQPVLKLKVPEEYLLPKEAP